jgi:hypothetical protein
MASQDDKFSASIKEALAKAVSYHCSNPDCGAVTVGPQGSIGEAAHITAASPGGARYSSDLKSTERAGIQNAIWLCRACHKLIDTNPTAYTEPMLRHWKKVAEDRADAMVRFRLDSLPAMQLPLQAPYEELPRRWTESSTAAALRLLTCRSWCRA